MPRSGKRSWLVRTSRKHTVDFFSQFLSIQRFGLVKYPVVGKLIRPGEERTDYGDALAVIG